MLSQEQLYLACVKVSTGGFAPGIVKRGRFKRDPAIYAACKAIHTYDQYTCVKYLRINSMGQKMTAYTRTVGYQREPIDPRQIAACAGV
jgi:hypothetical protein